MADPAVAPLAFIGASGFVLLAILAGLALLRGRMGGPEAHARVPTWGCGYAGPLRRAQYTASSFGQPLVQALSGILAVRASLRRPESTFAGAPTAEVVVPDRTGLLVPIEQADDGTGTPLDPDRYVADFATALTALVTDPDRAAAMGRAGRARATEHFSWTAIAHRTLEVYRAACGEPLA